MLNVKSTVVRKPLDLPQQSKLKNISPKGAEIQDIMDWRIAQFIMQKAESLFREGEKSLMCRELARRFYATMPMHVANNRETHIALTNVKYANRRIEFGRNGELKFSLNGYKN